MVRKTEISGVSTKKKKKKFPFSFLGSKNFVFVFVFVLKFSEVLSWNSQRIFSYFSDAFVLHLSYGSSVV